MKRDILLAPWLNSVIKEASERISSGVEFQMTAVIYDMDAQRQPGTSEFYDCYVAMKYSWAKEIIYANKM